QLAVYGGTGAGGVGGNNTINVQDTAASVPTQVFAATGTPLASDGNSVITVGGSVVSGIAEHSLFTAPGLGGNSQINLGPLALFGGGGFRELGDTDGTK